MSDLRVTKVFKIFVASPGELKSERKAITEICQDLNKNYLQEKGIEIAPVKFEDDTFTQYGADPQFIVNQQILKNFDAIIVMLWSRVGTKTPRAISGTIEEFNKAEAEYRKNGKPHIMIYFKRAGVDPISTNLNQLMHVQKFYKEVKQKGLNFEFKNIKEFKDRFRTDVRRWLDSINGASGKKTTLSVVRPRGHFLKQ